ncbi:MAG: glyoxalase superfamily protein [Verrucomicrobiota bacterium]
MTFSAPVPILRIFDVTRAKDHYLSFLGFQLDWENRQSENGPLYCQISKGGCVLHLSEHHGDACPGAAVRIETSGLREFHGLLHSQQYKYSRPALQSMPWGTDDLTVPDPFGNRVTFWQLTPEA